MSPLLKIKQVSSSPDFVPPSYMSEGASGMDLRADLQAPVILAPMDRRRIACGFAMELPEGYEAQVRPRSGLAMKHGITCLNSPGTIDHDYRGEIQVILINLGQEPFEIKSGDRIAQMVIQKTEQAAIEIVSELNDTSRSEGGFGSTGLR